MNKIVKIGTERVSIDVWRINSDGKILCKMCNMYYDLKKFYTYNVKFTYIKYVKCYCKECICKNQKLKRKINNKFGSKEKKKKIINDVIHYRCTRCKQYKNVDEFYKLNNSTSKCKISSECKTCRIKSSLERCERMKNEEK